MRHLRTSSYQLVPARTSLNQLVNTVYPYNCRVRTFGWYRTGTLVRTRKVLVRDFKHPYSRDEKFAATGRRFEWTDAKASVKARRAGDDTSARAVGVDLVSRRVVAVAGDVVADEETNRGAPEREDEGVGTARHP